MRYRGLCRRRLAVLAMGLALLPASWAGSARAGQAGTGEPIEKIALWDSGSGPHLRGVNVALRRFYPELDDAESLGPPPAGPPFVAGDFEAIAAMGANVVMITHPAPFAEAPPHAFEPETQRSLDRLVGLAQAADLFVVIAFRTGPGRSEFGFFGAEAGTWFDASLLNDSLWAERAAQDAWVAGWRQVAARYRGHPAVVGYELLLEPNSNHVGSDYRSDRLEIWDPQRFHRRYGGTLYDWNQLFPRIVAAIREVDPDMPLLVGGNGYSSIDFLPFIAVIPDPRIVYVVHQYVPRKYTHQPADRPLAYPGPIDADWDGVPEPVGRAFLDRLFAPVEDFAARHGAKLAVTEFGAMRWAPGIERFLGDEIDVLEGLGLNHLIYSWDSAFPAVRRLPSPFYFRFGPDPESRRPVADSGLLALLRSTWQRNKLRPSGVTFASRRP
jgi:hypothetical protein